ncbi:MAG TPA: hypothetical protein ENI94_14870 [Gammaproteobacteria bacterium]|nr:hypothetical protein [Gammaproteobacteria bacterium]
MNEFCRMRFEISLVLLSGCTGFSKEYMRAKGFPIVIPAPQGHDPGAALGNLPNRACEILQGMTNLIETGAPIHPR